MSKKGMMGLLLLTLLWGVPEPSTALAEMAHSGLPHGIPDFGANPTIMSVKGGPWDDPATWDLKRAPLPGDIVRIQSGHTVTLRTTDAEAWTVGVAGELIFDPAVNTQLKVVNLLVYGECCAVGKGELQIGTPDQPIAANVTAQVIFRDVPLDTGTVEMPGMDPAQFGNGLIGLGKVTIHGAVKNPTFVRLAREAKAGDATLALSEAVTGWRVRDRLFLPDSRQVKDVQNQVVAQEFLSSPQAKERSGLITSGADGGSAQHIWLNPHWEERVIEKVSEDGRTITLADPLQYDHNGAGNNDGVIELLPHVANLSRNVEFRSANPNGTTGHTMLTHRAEVDVQQAAFNALGRTRGGTLDNTALDADGKVTHIGTNQIGRYALHAHHLSGPVNPTNSGYQYRLIGNAVNGTIPSSEKDGNVGLGSSTKWGITIHNSHYGRVSDNVVCNIQTDGIATEDGSEYANEIHRNFVARAHGLGRDNDVTSGILFWGPMNDVTDNAVANSIVAYYTALGDNRNTVAFIPSRRGGEKDIQINRRAKGFLKFSGNEAYSSIDGFSNPTIVDRDQPGAEAIVVENFTSWNHGRDSIRVYAGTPTVIVKGLKVRGIFNKFSKLNPRLELAAVRWHGGGDLFIYGSDIQGVPVSIVDRARSSAQRLMVENTLLGGLNAGIVVKPWIQSPRKVILFQGVRFWPDAKLQIKMHGNAPSIEQAFKPLAFVVENHSGVQGDNFRVFYNEQMPDAILPSPGTHERGLTQKQHFEKYSTGWAGEIAPADAVKREKIHGVIQPLPADILSTPEFSRWADPTIHTIAKRGKRGLPDPNAAPTPKPAPVAKPAPAPKPSAPAPAPTANRAPVVNAGADRVITEREVNLRGRVTDDGLPKPPGRVTVRWRKVSGPGTVTFTRPRSTRTGATFSKAGIYLLQLRASDGKRSTTDTVKLDVR